jgi:glycosyltransferase involved in cell wall biosynthesis
MTADRPRLLCLAAWAPYPGIRHAGGEYLLRHLEVLSETFDVTLAVPGLGINIDAAPSVPSWLRLHLVPLPPRVERSRVLRRLANLALGFSPGAEIRLGLRRDPVVRELLAGADLVELHWPEYAALIPLVHRAGPAGCPITVIAQDSATQVLERYLSAGTSPARRARARLLVARVGRQEVHYLNQADAVGSFTPDVDDHYRALGVTVPLFRLPPAVAPVPDAMRAKPAAGETVLFTAALGRPQNHEGLLWLVDTVWPHVHSARPSSTLVVAGAGAPPAVEQRLRATAGVEFVGEVDDLSSCYRDAHVFVAPLFVGSGLKFKVVHALMAGLPVLTTAVGAEGLDPVDGPSPLLVHEEADGWVHTLVDLLADPTERARAGAASHAFAAATFDFAAGMAVVTDLYTDLVSSTRAT